MARRAFTQRRDKRGRRGDSEFQDEVLAIRVHTKVTKGGRTLTFGALVAVGDRKGKIGLGYGKARGVPMAIEKANKEAKRDMITVPLIGDTVGHEQTGDHKSSRVLIKPAAPGTGVKAGATVRSMMNVLGVRNVLTKSIGRNNPLNLAKATMNAFALMRPVAEVERLRNVKIALRHPQLVLKDKTVAPPTDVAPEASKAEAPQAPEAPQGPEAPQEPEAPPPTDVASEASKTEAPQAPEAPPPTEVAPEASKAEAPQEPEAAPPTDVASEASKTEAPQGPETSAPESTETPADSEPPSQEAQGPQETDAQNPQPEE
ncbi:MAG: 30S ribosomal protein S5 [Candidatus Brocadiia bacterium]|nr:30S ribosomal protein S5 [Candidatus Brocadiia bacterium]